MFELFKQRRSQKHHCTLRITSEEFDEVAKEFAKTLAFYKIPARETNEVMNAFVAYKPRVTAGAAALTCPFSRV